LLGHPRKVAIGSQEAERYATLLQDLADGERQAAAEVNVEDGTVERRDAGIAQAAVEAGGGSDWMHATLGDEIADHFGEEVIVLYNQDLRAGEHAIPLLSKRSALNP
jgi:hypothetical protein